jgi:predicted secreted Zn-dependent protease
MVVLLDEVNPEAAANSKKIISRSPPQIRDLGKRHPETGGLP